MLKVNSILLIMGVAILLTAFKTVESASEDIVSFPYEKTPCAGKGLLGAICCQGIRVSPINFNKTMCVEFVLKLLPPKADVKIYMDNKVVSEFTIDPKNPPTYCIPVILPVDVAMCLRLHDVKLIGLTALQICSTAYVNYQTNKVFEHKMPCVKLDGTGINMIETKT